MANNNRDRRDPRENKSISDGMRSAIDDMAKQNQESNKTTIKSLKEMQRGIKEGTVRTQDVISVLQDWKKEEMGDDTDTRELRKFNETLSKLYETSDDFMDPEMFNNMMSDLMGTMDKERTEAFKGLMTEVHGVNQAMMDGLGRMTRVFSGAFGPLMDIKEIGMGLFETFKNTGARIIGLYMAFRNYRNTTKKIGDEQKSELKNINSSMGSMVNIQESQLTLDQSRHRRELLEKKPDKKYTVFGILGAIMGTVVGSIVALAGGLLSYFMLPFQVTFNILNSVASRIGGVLRTLGFGRIVDLFQSVFGRVTRLVGRFVNVFSSFGRWIATFTGHASSFVRSFARTARFMPVIGQAIAIVMGIIDFFRGFISAEGDILDRIGAGLRAAIMGFFEPVFKFFGWIADWALGLFGFEIEGGVAAKAIDFFENGLKFLFDSVANVLRSLYDNILWLPKKILDFVSNILPSWDTITDRIGDIIDIGAFIVNNLRELPNKLFNWIQGIIPSWEDITDRIGDITSGTVDFTKNIIDNITDIPKKVTEWIMDKIPSASDIWDGIKGAPGAAADAVKGFFGFGGSDDEEDEDINRGTKDHNENIRSRNNIMGSFQTGGHVPETGIYKLHKGEEVIPESDVKRYREESINREKTLIQYLSKMLKQLQHMENTIENLKSDNNDENQSSRAPTIQTEPPEDIENLGLLLYTKNWGLS